MPNSVAVAIVYFSIAFARLYGIGIAALNFEKAPRIAAVVERHPVDTNAAAGLSGAPLSIAIDFITRNRPLAALRQRAMFQAIVAVSARNGGGGARATINAVQVVRNFRNTDKAVVLAAGRPGRLRDIHSLDMARLPGAPTTILAGQHAQLPWAARMRSRNKTRATLSWW